MRRIVVSVLALLSLATLSACTSLEEVDRLHSVGQKR